jgi:hypothetical protein
MATVLQPDVVDLVWKALSDDTTLKTIQGLSITKKTERRVLASTSAEGNKVVIINKEGEVPVEFKTGCQGVIMAERVRIDIVAKTVEGTEDARAAVDTIRKKIREVMSLQEFLGTGWLYHKEVGDRWPSPPTSTRAYNILRYDFVTSFGKV